MDTKKMHLPLSLLLVTLAINQCTAECHSPTPTYKIISPCQCTTFVKANCLNNKTRGKASEILCVNATSDDLISELKKIGGYNPRYAAVDVCGTLDFKPLTTADYYTSSIRPPSCESQKTTQCRKQLGKCTNNPIPPTPTTEPHPTRPTGPTRPTRPMGPTRPTWPTRPTRYTRPIPDIFWPPIPIGRPSRTLPTPTRRHNVPQDENGASEQKYKDWDEEDEGSDKDSDTQESEDSPLEIAKRMPGKMTVGNCLLKGTPIQDTGSPAKRRLCSVCPVVKYMADDVIPRYINERVCQHALKTPPDHTCVGNIGQCVQQQSIKIPGLRRRGYKKSVALSNTHGKEIWVGDWSEVVEIVVRSCCECMLFDNYYNFLNV